MIAQNDHYVTPCPLLTHSLTMALINKQNTNPITSFIDSFPLIVTTEILKHCQDYEILKRSNRHLQYK